MTETSMRTLAACLALAGGLWAGVAGAQDMAAMARDQVGTPLAVSDAAAQPWALEDDGRSVCQVRLQAAPAANGAHAVEISPQCGASLPANVAGWKPVTDGAALVDAQGQTLIDFNRWSNSLLVEHRATGGDLQLRRAG